MRIKKILSLAVVLAMVMAVVPMFGLTASAEAGGDEVTLFDYTQYTSSELYTQSGSGVGDLKDKGKLPWNLPYGVNFNTNYGGNGVWGSVDNAHPALMFFHTSGRGAADDYLTATLNDASKSAAANKLDIKFKFASDDQWANYQTWQFKDLDGKIFARLYADVGENKTINIGLDGNDVSCFTKEQVLAARGTEFEIIAEIQDDGSYLVTYYVDGRSKHTNSVPEINGFGSITGIAHSWSVQYSNMGLMDLTISYVAPTSSTAQTARNALNAMPLGSVAESKVTLPSTVSDSFEQSFPVTWKSNSDVVNAENGEVTPQKKITDVQLTPSAVVGSGTATGGAKTVTILPADYKAGDTIVFEGTKYKLTGNNLIDNGDFSDGVSGWYDRASETNDGKLGSALKTPSTVFSIKEANDVHWIENTVGQQMNVFRYVDISDQDADKFVLSYYTHSSNAYAAGSGRMQAATLDTSFSRTPGKSQNVPSIGGHSSWYNDGKEGLARDIAIDQGWAKKEFVLDKSSLGPTVYAIYGTSFGDSDFGLTGFQLFAVEEETVEPDGFAPIEKKTVIKGNTPNLPTNVILTSEAEPEVNIPGTVSQWTEASGKQADGNLEVGTYTFTGTVDGHAEIKPTIEVEVIECDDDSLVDAIKSTNTKGAKDAQHKFNAPVAGKVSFEFDVTYKNISSLIKNVSGAGNIGIFLGNSEEVNTTGNAPAFGNGGNAIGIQGTYVGNDPTSFTFKKDSKSNNSGNFKVHEGSKYRVFITTDTEADTYTATIYNPDGTILHSEKEPLNYRYAVTKLDTITVTTNNISTAAVAGDITVENFRVSWTDKENYRTSPLEYKTAADGTLLGTVDAKMYKVGDTISARSIYSEGKIYHFEEKSIEAGANTAITFTPKSVTEYAAVYDGFLSKEDNKTSYRLYAGNMDNENSLYFSGGNGSPFDSDENIIVKQDADGQKNYSDGQNVGAKPRIPFVEFNVPTGDLTDKCVVMYIQIYRKHGHMKDNDVKIAAIPTDFSYIDGEGKDRTSDGSDHSESSSPSVAIKEITGNGMTVSYGNVTKASGTANQWYETGQDKELVSIDVTEAVKEAKAKGKEKIEFFLAIPKAILGAVNLEKTGFGGAYEGQAAYLSIEDGFKVTVENADDKLITKNGSKMISTEFSAKEGDVIRVYNGADNKTGRAYTSVNDAVASTNDITVSGETTIKAIDLPDAPTASLGWNGSQFTIDFVPGEESDGEGIKVYGADENGSFGDATVIGKNEVTETGVTLTTNVPNRIYKAVATTRNGEVEGPASESVSLYSLVVKDIIANVINGESYTKENVDAARLKAANDIIAKGGIFYETEATDDVKGLITVSKDEDCKITAEIAQKAVDIGIGFVLDGNTIYFGSNDENSVTGSGTYTKLVITSEGTLDDTSVKPEAADGSVVTLDAVNIEFVETLIEELEAAGADADVALTPEL